MESSFCFDSSEEDEYEHAQDFTQHSLEGSSDEEKSYQSEVSTPSILLESGEEIWETSSAEEAEQSESESATAEPEAISILYTISFFLNFLQLTYRISERAMSLILTFLRLLLNYVSIMSQTPLFIHLSSKIPKSLNTIRKLIHNKSNGLCEFVVCSKCHALYEPSKCIVKEHGQEQSKYCDYIEYPRHPHSSRRLKCNTPLMKWVRVGGKSKLVPCKTFLYHSVIAGIGRLLQNEHFLSSCELWRRRNIPSGIYCDIYDGKVWQDFQHVNGIPFLADAGSLNLCLTLNVDWFNPYEETQYSVGAIYLVVQNLPRSERFKVSNIILVGLIPGPKEPKSINPYLDLLVDDLHQLFHGVNIPYRNTACNEIKVRALLTCIVSDLPATRKVCGFLGVNATQGCSKCKKMFSNSHIWKQA